jgi:hydrogenase maturation factor
MRVLAAAGGAARCAGEDGAVHEDVATELVDPVAPGDVLLVHAGVALANLGAAAR